MKSNSSEQRNFRSVFVLLLVCGITLLFLAVAWPFLQPLFLAALFSALASPLYRWLKRLCKGRSSLASFLTLLVLFVIIAGPVSGFLGLVIRQAFSVSNEAIPWAKQHLQSSNGFQAHDWLVKRFPQIASYVPDQTKLVESASNVVKAAGAGLVDGASKMGAGTVSFLLNLFVMLYAMFFFLKDGTSILEKILYYIPLRHEDEVRMLQRLTSVTRATIKGTIVLGLIQGTLAGFAFWVAGIDGAAFWGTTMVFLSIVPGIGAALVWVPAVIYLYLSGHNVPATLLGLWCIAVVGTVDNGLRPMLVGKDAGMPDLLIMIGTLGGLFLFGPIGFIIGPVVCGLFLTMWDIYGTTFRNILPPAKSIATGELLPLEAMRADAAPVSDKIENAEKTAPPVVKTEPDPVKTSGAKKQTTRKPVKKAKPLPSKPRAGRVKASTR